MKRGAKLFIKGFDGNECGPFRWTEVREWVAIGYFSPKDEVRLSDESTWSHIETIPELLVTPPSYDVNGPFQFVRGRAREKRAVGPRATAYLKVLGCPVAPGRLNPYTAFRWVGILEDLRPHLANQTENWAADEESKGRVPTVSPTDATPKQIEYLQSLGHAPAKNVTRLEAHRLISGPPSEGQLRRLRFYGVSLPDGACKDEASTLIDSYGRDHPESEAAYQACRETLIAEKYVPQTPAPQQTSWWRRIFGG